VNAAVSALGVSTTQRALPVIPSVHGFLPQDRARALLAGRTLPVDCEGSALFADISGFTALTEGLVQSQGQRRGIESMSQRLQEVYTALIAPVEAHGGSVVAFAGDGLFCWFDASLAGGLPAAALRATTCAQAMLQAMTSFSGLSLKAGLASGPALRLELGQMQIQRLDLLTGDTVAQAVHLESLAAAGELRMDEASEAAVLGAQVHPPAGVPGPAKPPQPPQPAESAAVQATLGPWLLPQMMERHLSSQGLFASDLRPAAALFVRWPGLQQDAAARRWSAVVVAQAQGLLHAHGGTLLELACDASGLTLYANFGALQVHEDDAARALRAALALRSPKLWLADAPAVADAGSPPSPWRPGAPQIGLAFGTMFVGGYGGPTRRSFGAMGDDVNTAARLMDLAQAGEILVAGSLRQRLPEGLFELEPRPPIPVRGKAEPMPVFAATGVGQRRALRLQAPVQALPLVGRQGELERIAQGLALARGGHGRVLMLRAPAGLGKSRLAAEAVSLASRDGFICYGGSTAAAEAAGSPYLLWHAVWAAFFDLDPALPARRQHAALQRALAAYVPEHAEAWPVLAPALGLELPDNAFSQTLAPGDRKTLLQSVLLRCLEAAVQDAAEDGVGLLLVLEGLHEADPLSLQLLHQVVSAMAAWPMLLLLSARPEDEAAEQAGSAAQGLAGLPERSGVEALNLAPLTPQHMEQLVRAKLAQLFPQRADAVPAALIRSLGDRAQGNPLYAQELLAYLRDRGLDPRQASALAALDWPDSLHSLMLSRIDLLPAAQRRWLKAASVVGTSFGEDDLAACARALGDDWREALQGLVRAGLTPPLAPDGAAAAGADAAAGAAPDEHLPAATGSARYAFAHRLTREVAYQSLARSTRTHLHATLAEHLEQAPSQRLDALAPSLAQHFLHASLPQRAGPWAQRAGDAAARAYANDEALAHYALALECLAGEATEAAAVQRLTLHQKRTAVFELQSRHEEQTSELVLAAACLPGLAPQQAERGRAELALAHVQLAMDLGRFEAAAAHAQQALRHAQSPGQRCDAHLASAWACFATGDAVAAGALLDEALRIAREQGDKRRERQVLSRRGLLHWQSGEFEPAQVWLEQALALLDDQSGPRVHLDMLNNLGVIAKARARHALALQHYEAALAMARRIGDRSGQAMLLSNMGSVALAAGRFVQAAQHSERAAALFVQLGEPVPGAIALINLGEARRELGQLDAARVLGERALEALRAHQARLGEAVVLENLGLVALAQGRLQDADRAFGEAALLAQSLGAKALQASVRKHQGDLLQAQQRQAEARACWQQAMSELQLLGARRECAEARASMALSVLDEGHADAGAQAFAVLREDIAQLLEPPAESVATGSLRLHRAAWRAAVATQAPCADALRALAQARLDECLAQLSDPQARHSYLQLPEHRWLAKKARP
jgi:class 3 adenylate cyclase/tetratricopeptide (TPR) repeat protein